MKYFRIFRQSAEELKNIRCLTVTGLLIAIYGVLEFMGIMPNTSLKINFGFLAVGAIGMLYGPVVGIFGAAACDIVGVLVKPAGGFNPIFTLIAAVQGLIYGMIAYRMLSERTGKSRYIEMTVRMVIARLLDIGIVNIVMNTLVVYYFTSYGATSGRTIGAYFGIKIAKNLGQLPVDLILVVLLTPIILKIFEGVFGRRRTSA